MNSDSKHDVAAAVLTTALGGPPAPLDLQSLLEPAPLRLRLRYARASLDVPYFHYRVYPDGTVVALHEHWRRCAHPRHRR